MDWQSAKLSIAHAKRAILVAVITASVSGCALKRGVHLASNGTRAAVPVALREDLRLAGEIDPQQPKAPSNVAVVQPAAYTDGVVLASPVVFAHPQEVAKERSFGQFLELDASQVHIGASTLPETEEVDFDEFEVYGKTFSDDELSWQANGQSEGGNSEERNPEDFSLPAASSGQPVEYFVQQALAAHPSIRAVRQRVAAELDRIPQVTALPDPQLNNTFWPLHDNATQTAAGRIANQMSLQQGIPLPDKLRTKGVIVSREAQMAQAEVERIERKITESVRLAYYEVWYATRAIRIIEETRDLVDDLTKVAEARYRAGGTQQDVLRAQLETDRLDNQLVQLQKQKEVSQADLAALLQQPVSLMAEATEELGVTDAPLQLDSLIALAEQCNPSLRGLAAEIQRDRQKQRLACLQQYPDFMVGLNWGIVSDRHDVISPVANGNDNLSITFGTTLPVWRKKINAGVREANRRTSSTMQRLEAERDEIYGRLRRLLAQADSLVEQTDIYESRLIPRTEDTLKLAIADYRGERTDFFTLIETYRELLMFEIQLARINASLAGTIAQVDRTVGCPY